MIVKINGQIVEFANKINAVEAPLGERPNISVVDILKQTEQAKECIDLSSPEAYFQTGASCADIVNYHWMSKFETTEFIYKFSKWSVGEILTTLNVI